MNTAAAMPNGTGEINADEVEVEHAVNAINQNVLNKCVDQTCDQQHAINSKITEQSNLNSDNYSDNKDIQDFKRARST